MSQTPEVVSPGSDDAAESLALVHAAVRAADAKLGLEPVALDVGALLSVVDYFVVVAGRNTPQISTIVEEIEAVVKRELGRSPVRIEGLREPTWVLMDYGDVVIHVFLDETRQFYDLEHLWSSAPVLDLSGVVGPVVRALDDEATHPQPAGPTIDA